MNSEALSVPEKFAETQSERARRYMSSAMCEIRDPEEWMVYSHGQSSSSETEP